MIDLLKDTETGDLRIEGDDLVLGVSDQQHRGDLLVTDKGAVKQFPDAGVGAQKFLEAEDKAGLLREIALQFGADGMTVRKLSIEDGIIYPDAPYKS
jgi:hypothetical protein